MPTLRNWFRLSSISGCYTPFVERLRAMGSILRSASRTGRYYSGSVRARAQKPWAILDPNFDKIIAQQVGRRIISVIQH